MTDDLLTQFRSSVQLPDEATAQRVHARATDGRRKLRRRPLVLALVAAVGVAFAAAAFAGAFSTGEPPVATTGEQGPAPMTIAYSRTEGTLNSIAVTLSLDVSDATVRLQVVNVDSKEVVFEEQVSTTDTPPAALLGPTGDTSPEPNRSFWSGTLYPTDWNGGCQAGRYQIRYSSATGGSGDSEWFSCRG